MDLKVKIDELGTAFEGFKKANDARLKEIEEKGSASGDAQERVKKYDAAIQKLEGEIESLTKAMNRTGGQGGGAQETEEQLDKKAQAKYRSEFAQFMRKDAPLSQESRDWFKKTMSVDSDQDGGFLVNPEMSSEVVKKVFESSPIRQLASVQTISTDSLEMIADLDEVGSGWVGETGTRGTSATPVVKKLIFPVHELFSMPLATQKLLDDAGVNLESWLGEKCSDKFARDEATAFVSGNGVGKPMGILSYASGTSFNQVERVTTGAVSILGDDLIELQSRLKEAYQNNATWLMNRLLIGTIRKLKDVTSGQYIWQPGLAVGAPATLLGRPVAMASDLPSSVVAATDTLIYGDIKAAYQVVDRIGIRVLRDPFTYKGYVAFYTTKRVGGGVKNFEASKILKIHA